MVRKRNTQQSGSSKTPKDEAKKPLVDSNKKSDSEPKKTEIDTSSVASSDGGDYMVNKHYDAEFQTMGTYFVFGLFAGGIEMALYFHDHHLVGLVAGAITMLLTFVFIMQTGREMKLNKNIKDFHLFGIENPTLDEICRMLAKILVVFVVILAAISVACHLTTPYTSHFPENCKHPDGCTRLTRFNPTRSGVHLSSVGNISFQTNNIRPFLHEWFKTEMGGYKVVRENDDFVHVQFSTPVMGFVDDYFFEFRKCYHDVWAVYSHSELRIGRYDFMTNDQRVLRLYNFLTEQFPPEKRYGQC